ncbi:thioesterase domain-containing protein [Streptomyces cinnabarinus]|uniref:Thioesterase domain-containing protein n=1 Tax=Streptomyces cinnabarinus TaxID=67287 RepID=A0ABY7KKS8_9ACTN|nr:thioesterase domain-containing protein [Streptomyces cinnabarinus]WAZ24638.1 thioesterase domain-containing protein [Streptomyces cinnabarinus]
MTRSSRLPKLFCFPHAGAGTSAFGGWPARLGDAALPVPVLLPGRDGRRREPRVTTVRGLFADLLRHHGPPPEEPYVLYGHSLGGLIAYSVARALERTGRRGPELVVVGACPPPDSRTPLVDACDLPDDRLLDVLETFGAVEPGTPRGGVWQRTALGVIRDDLRLARELRRAADAPLTTPLLTVAGTDDPLAGPRVMDGWRAWADGVHGQRTVAGDHHFVRGRALPELLARLCRDVRRPSPADAAPYERQPLLMKGSR